MSARKRRAAAISKVDTWEIRGGKVPDAWPPATIAAIVGKVGLPLDEHRSADLAERLRRAVCWLVIPTFNAGLPSAGEMAERYRRIEAASEDLLHLLAGPSMGDDGYLDSVWLHLPDARAALMRPGLFRRLEEAQPRLLGLLGELRRASRIAAAAQEEEGSGARHQGNPELNTFVARLAEVFEVAFERRATATENGRFVRFVGAVLGQLRAEIPEDQRIDALRLVRSNSDEALRVRVREVLRWRSRRAEAAPSR